MSACLILLLSLSTKWSVCLSPPLSLSLSACFYFSLSFAFSLFLSLCIKYSLSLCCPTTSSPPAYCSYSLQTCSEVPPAWHLRLLRPFSLDHQPAKQQVCLSVGKQSIRPVLKRLSWVLSRFLNNHLRKNFLLVVPVFVCMSKRIEPSLTQTPFVASKIWITIRSPLSASA